MSGPDNPLLAGHKPKPRQPVPGELLFEFYVERTKAKNPFATFVLVGLLTVDGELALHARPTNASRTTPGSCR